MFSPIMCPKHLAVWMGITFYRANRMLDACAGMKIKAILSIQKKSSK
jgi:hypothetical protein